MHDHTHAYLETSYFPNDAAAPVVFGEIASILQRIEPQRGSPYGLCSDVKKTVQEILGLGAKGRLIKTLDQPAKPRVSEELALEFAV